MTNHNIVQVINLFIKELQIPVTRRSVISELEKHPDFPSQFAISDVLNSWNIPNASYRLNFEELLATGISTPFIAHFNSNQGEFVLITQFNQEKIVASNQRWNKKSLTVEEFRQFYSGAILIAEKEQASGEINFQSLSKKERIEGFRVPGLLFMGILLLVIALTLVTPPIQMRDARFFLLGLSKSLGLITSILLLTQYIDTDNALIKKLCNREQESGCYQILGSGASRITKNLSWSEVGFFYFAGTWIIFLFMNNTAPVLGLLAILSTLCLPYTVYSLFYQWRVAKSWCILCCCIQALIWTESVLLVPYLNMANFHVSLREISQLVICLALPILIWSTIKPFLKQRKQLNILQNELRKFKYSSGLFGHLLSEQPELPMMPQEDTIVLGNTAAPNVLTLVTSTSCEPCMKAHELLMDWLTYRDDFKVQIVFAVVNHPDNPFTRVASYLLNLRGYADQSLASDALHQWYKRTNDNIEHWIKVIPDSYRNYNVELLQSHTDWCNDMDVMSTPTVFINGRRLPELYQLQHIKYLLNT